MPWQRDQSQRHNEENTALNSIKGSIHRDPFIRSFLDKTPKDVAETFTDAQLLQLKLMFRTRANASRLVMRLLATLLLFMLIIAKLYLVKSFLGIDVFPRFSFGFWAWLSSL